MSTQLSTKFDLESLPIQNIWLLMAYAGKARVPFDRLQSSTTRPPEDLPNLLIELLSGEISKRLRGKLSVGYKEVKSELPRLRGRVNHIDTARRHSMMRGQIVCQYEELTHDTPLNQLARYALKRLHNITENQQMRKLCSQVDQRLESVGVSKIEIYPQNLRAITPQPRDVLMFELSKLALRLDIPTQNVGSQRLVDPKVSENWVRTLFEDAIGGFYRHHLMKQGWTVKTGRTFGWDIIDPSSRIDSLMPRMKTDIELINPDKTQKIVIDTKFKTITKSTQFGGETFDSGNIYQIYSYVLSQEKSDSIYSQPTVGMLLYPTTGVSLREEVTIQKHRFRFVTVDLMRSPAEISEELMELVRN